MAIHRPHSYGGLGLHSVKYKALAGYITTFLQTASNPSFCPNLLHSQLYRKQLLGEELPCDLRVEKSDEAFHKHIFIRERSWDIE